MTAPSTLLPHRVAHQGSGAPPWPPFTCRRRQPSRVSAGASRRSSTSTQVRCPRLMAPLLGDQSTPLAGTCRNAGAGRWLFDSCCVPCPSRPAGPGSAHRHRRRRRLASRLRPHGGRRGVGDHRHRPRSHTRPPGSYWNASTAAIPAPHNAASAANPCGTVTVLTAGAAARRPPAHGRVGGGRPSFWSWASRSIGLFALSAHPGVPERTT